MRTDAPSDVGISAEIRCINSLLRPAGSPCRSDGSVAAVEPFSSSNVNRIVTLLRGQAHGRGGPPVSTRTRWNARTMDYLSLKYLHIGLAGLSGGFFLTRGAWMLGQSPLLQNRWVRTLPHMVDTALLSSAVVLAAWSSQYPIAQAWLTAKVLALAVYIILGMVALKRGRTRRIRGVAYFAALLVFSYIVGVAMSKDPGFLLNRRGGGTVAVDDAVRC